MLNKVFLLGNLGADPEVRTTAGGTAVANLRIATTSRRKDKDGNWSDKTEWHSVTCFGKSAENVGKYLAKGTKVHVEGELETQSWEKDGQKHSKTVIIAHEVKFIDSRARGHERAVTGQNPDLDADIPF